MLDKLFKYNHDINLQLVQDIDDLGSTVPEKSLELFSHILNSHHTWLCRITGHAPLYGIWERHVSNSFNAIEEANYRQTTEILDNRKLEEIISYSNSSGQAFKNSIEDILVHVVNHSTYHRGQIAMVHRQHEIQPLATDYIMYRRNLNLTS